MWNDVIKIFGISVILSLNHSAFLIAEDTIPPVLDIEFSAVDSNVTINLTSSEDLVTGWFEKRHFYTSVEHDWWSLRPRLATDFTYPFDDIYSSVWLYEYSNPSRNQYYIHMDINGKIIDSIPDWSGWGGTGWLIVQDEEANWVYLGEVTLGWDGAVDEENRIHMTYMSNMGDSLYYIKVDSDGVTSLIDTAFTDSILGWCGGSRIEVDSHNNPCIVWSRNTTEICWIKSFDGGHAWTETHTLSYTGQRAIAPEIVIDICDNIHIIWSDARDIGGFNYELYYAKLNENGTTMIDATRLTFFIGSYSVWYPTMYIDFNNHIHIVWGNYTTSTTSYFYYTKIDGNLDCGGGSSTDEELTLIQEEQIIGNPVGVRYPKIVTDFFDNVFIVYEEGQYGCLQTKMLYLRKFARSPVVKLTSPDGGIQEIMMSGSGSTWTGNFMASVEGEYIVDASGTDSAGNTGTARGVFYQTGIEETKTEKWRAKKAKLEIYPNPFSNTTVIRYLILDAGSWKNEGEQNISESVGSVSGNQQSAIKIFDVSGRLVRNLPIHQLTNSQINQLSWSGDDDLGRKLPTGVYFVQLTMDKFSTTEKLIKLE